MPRGHTRAIVTLSDEAKAYKREVVWIAQQAGVIEPIAGRVSVEIRLYPQRPLDWAKRARRNPMSWDDDVRCMDLDNANKVLLDSLNGIAYEDDRRVCRIMSERMEPDGQARVVVVVRPLDQQVSPQGDLLEACAPS